MTALAITASAASPTAIAHRARRGAPFGIERAIGVFADVLAFDGRAIGQELDHHRPQTSKRRSGGDGAERLVKLLGRRIGRREHTESAHRGDAWP